MQRTAPKLNLTQSLEPGRYHKRDFEPKLTHGFIQGEQASYDVLEVIGKGGTSKVKLLENRATHAKRALKIISPKDAFDQSKKAYHAFYENEYNILKLLKRIDPVKIKTISKKRIHKYQIVMDYVEGYELWELINNKRHLLPTDPKKLIQLGLNILVDLFEMHQKGILLVDDKTKNIIVDPKTLKVTRIDFGFAIAGYDFKKDPGKEMPFRATIAVAPPEVISDGIVTFNQATDMYTVGVVLRELLMGEVFSFSLSITLKKITPKWESFLFDYPQIKSLLSEMTSYDPKKRPSSLEEVIEKFEEALGLEKGCSIAKLKEEEKPSENTSNPPTFNASSPQLEQKLQCTDLSSSDKTSFSGNPHTTFAKKLLPMTLAEDPYFSTDEVESVSPR